MITSGTAPPTCSPPWTSASSGVYGECHPTRDSAQFLAFLKASVKPYADKRIHVVLDNLSTHTSATESEPTEVGPNPLRHSGASLS
jgi:hypothetical protein